MQRRQSSRWLEKLEVLRVFQAEARYVERRRIVKARRLRKCMLGRDRSASDHIVLTYPD